MKEILRSDAEATTTFSTTDLGCTVGLICSGFDLISLDRTDPRKVRFVFREQSGLQEAVTDYWDDRLQVKARSMFDNLKSIKSRIYSG